MSKDPNILDDTQKEKPSYLEASLPKISMKRMKFKSETKSLVAADRKSYGKRDRYPRRGGVRVTALEK